MSDLSLAGHILSPSGFVRGRVEVLNGRVHSLTGEPVDEDAVRDSRLPVVLPGFIDLHVHGGGGHDVMEGGDAAAAVARLHARHGTTAMLATTLTAPLEEIRGALRALAPVIAQRPEGAARVLGVHLEGPYLNPDKLGAQPDFPRAGSVEEVLGLHALAPLRLVTLAPEVPGHLQLIAPLRAAGLQVQVGHTTGTYEDGLAALAAGATGFTHLFNAMSPLHQRAPGMVGAALAHATYAEVIPDLVTVHPGAIRVGLRAIPCLYCVTDATAASGMPDGEYALGRHRVFKCLGGVRLADGTLAGSCLTMDQALRNLVSLGLGWVEASARTATHAANYLGMTDRGRIAPGAHADFVLLDRDLALQRVFVEGEAIEPAGAPPGSGIT